MARQDYAAGHDSKMSSWLTQGSLWLKLIYRGVGVGRRGGVGGEEGMSHCSLDFTMSGVQ